MNNQVGFERQDMELFKQFVEFCDRQPKDRVIDHSTWDTCAYGDFVSEADELCYPYQLFGCDTLMDQVGNGNCPDTYGPFTEFLMQYLPEGSYWNSSEPS